MKKYLVLTCLFSTSICAEPLYNFHDIESAIRKHESIRIGIVYSHCQSQPKDLRDVIEQFIPNSVKLTYAGSKEITASVMKFTFNHPLFPGKGVYEYFQYNFYPNNNVTLKLQVLDATNYLPLGVEYLYQCKITNARNNVYGVSVVSS